MDSETEPVDILADDSRYNESFINFLKEIMGELVERKGIEVPSEFVLNMVKLAAINPDNKFLIKQQMVDTEIDRLKRIVIERIVEMSELSRTMIRMQIHYRDHCRSRDEVIEADRKEDTEKVNKLIGELRKSVPKHIRHYDFYYSKLMGATIYFANMGPDTEISVVNETEGAWVEKRTTLPIKLLNFLMKFDLLLFLQRQLEKSSIKMTSPSSYQ